MSNADYKDNRDLGDKFMPQVKAILGQTLLRDDFTFEDQKHNTDLMVLRMSTERIGVRIRRFDDVWNGYDKVNNQYWRDQFTIRYRLASGYPTEFDKIIYNNWGDYFFYGIADKTEKYLIKWTVGSLDAFRTYVNKGMREDKDFISSRLHSNSSEKDSEFLTFSIDEIPDFKVAQSKDLKQSPKTMMEWTEFLLPEGLTL